MINSNTGGLAFPIKGPIMTTDELGMTLRDYFAGQALQGLMSIPIDKWPDNWHMQGPPAPHAVKACYHMADAMLEARKK